MDLFQLIYFYIIWIEVSQTIRRDVQFSIVFLTLQLYGAIFCCLSVRFSRLVVSDTLQPHGLPCPSPTPRVYSNSCPWSRWCHPTISSVVPFSSCLQSLPASGSFQMSQFFTPSGQSIGVSASASVLPMNIQDWFPFGWTDWISL